MKYRIEQIISYLDSHQDQYNFYIREYASPRGEYHNEAVAFDCLVSDEVGVIIETMPFNPVIYYTLPEVKRTFARLDDKAKRVKRLLRIATESYVKNKDKHQEQ